MDQKIRDYRIKHKKCKWCKYYKWNDWEEGHWCICYGECLIKDRIIKTPNRKRKCKYYELKENKDEI